MLDNIRKNEEGSYSPIGNYKRLETNACCSKIYKKDNILKIYYPYIPESFRITEDIFKKMKDINCDNFVRLLDYYFDGKMIAYTSEFIDYNKEDNILDKDVDFIKYNLIEMEKLILLFTKLGIAITDVNYRNYLLSKERLILIDPDSYRFVSDDVKETLEFYNYKKLLDSFRDLFVRSYYKIACSFSVGSETFNNMMNDVFHYDKTIKEPVYTACKRLEELNINNYRKN